MQHFNSCNGLTRLWPNSVCLRPCSFRGDSPTRRAGNLSACRCEKRRISLSGLLERPALPITALYGMTKIYYPFALPLSMHEIQSHAAVWYLTSPNHSANSLNQNQIRSNQKSLNLKNEILIIIVSRTNKVRQWGRFSLSHFYF